MPSPLAVATSSTVSPSIAEGSLVPLPGARPKQHSKRALPAAAQIGDQSTDLSTKDGGQNASFGAAKEVGSLPRQAPELEPQAKPAKRSRTRKQAEQTAAELASTPGAVHAEQGAGAEQDMVGMHPVHTAHGAEVGQAASGEGAVQVAHAESTVQAASGGGAVQAVETAKLGSKAKKATTKGSTTPPGAHTELSPVGVRTRRRSIKAVDANTPRGNAETEVPEVPEAPAEISEAKAPSEAVSQDNERKATLKIKTKALPKEEERKAASKDKEVKAVSKRKATKASSKENGTEAGSQEKETKAVSKGPTRALEQRLWAKGCKIVAGVDEAGRGPLAGPVVVAACVVPAHVHIQGIHDSKKLNEKQREDVFREIVVHPEILWATQVVGVDTIDELNILQATFHGMCLVVKQLCESHQVDHVLVDGNLLPPQLSVPATAIVKGDSSCYAIAAASILAKVTRDRLMIELDKEYPEYGFAKHKGYGTANHMVAIRKHKPCPEHRKSFQPIKGMVAEEGNK